MSVGAAVIGPAAKLPVGRTLLRAYGTLLKNLSAFVRTAAFPLTLGVLLPWAWHEFYPLLFDWTVELFGYPAAEQMERLSLSSIVERVVAWFALVLFMSRWLQFLTSNAVAKKPPASWIFSRADLRMLRYGLLLLTMTICTVLLQLLSTLLLADAPASGPLRLLMSATRSSFFVFTLVAIDSLLVGRSAPVFAAAATGQPITLRQAWRATRGHTLRLMLLWFILYWVTAALAGPLQAVANDLYVTLIINAYEPGEYVGTYYSPPFVQLVSLPSALVHCAALALGSTLFLRVYRGEADAQDDLLERFD